MEIEKAERTLLSGWTPVRYHPPMTLYNRRMDPVDVGGLYGGQVCFLLCGGPSLGDAELWKLETRGIVTMAVNNAWALFRPNLWVGVDSPRNFLNAGWRDPGILKMTPIGHLMTKLRRKILDEDQKPKFVDDELACSEAPNTLFFKRATRLRVREFMHEPAVCWGNGDEHVDELGIRGKRNVMLAALKLCYYLGFRRVYLLGVDFGMQYGAQNYAFPETRTKGSVTHNNAQYAAMNRRMEALLPEMHACGFTVFNCTRNSGLVTVEHRELDAAIEDALRDFTGDDTGMDTAGWYTEKRDDLGEDHEDYQAIYERLYKNGYHGKASGWMDRSHAEEYLIPWMVDHLKFKTILDVGCSYGAAVRKLNDGGYHAFGIDVSSTAVNEAIKAGLNVRAGSATAIPFLDRQFDVVMAADVMEHLHPADVPRAVDEAIRVSKKYVAMRIPPWKENMTKFQELAGLDNLHLTTMATKSWIDLFALRAAAQGRECKLIAQSAKIPLVGEPEPDGGYDFILELS